MLRFLLTNLQLASEKSTSSSSCEVHRILLAVIYIVSDPETFMCVVTIIENQLHRRRAQMGAMTESYLRRQTNSVLPHCGGPSDQLQRDTRMLVFVSVICSWLSVAHEMTGGLLSDSVADVQALQNSSSASNTISRNSMRCLGMFDSFSSSSWPEDD